MRIFLTLIFVLGFIFCFSQKKKNNKIKPYISYYKNGNVHFRGNVIDTFENCILSLERTVYKDWYSCCTTDVDTIDYICLIGKWDVYYENGQLRETGHFDTTIQILKFWFPPFNEDGSVKDLKEPFEYRKTIISSRDGLWKFYNDDGKLIRKTIFNKRETGE